MLSPAISALSISLSHQHSDSAKNTLSRLIYTFCKTRGYKVISRFFPHSIPDLVLVINASRSFTQTVTWEFRYVVLLWLSIAIKIPFDLGKILPGEDVAAQLQGLCTEYFFYPGKEREGAVLVLSRAFMRSVFPTPMTCFYSILPQTGHETLPLRFRWLVLRSTQLTRKECFYRRCRYSQLYPLTPLQGTFNPPILLRDPQS